MSFTFSMLYNLPFEILLFDFLSRLASYFILLLSYLNGTTSKLDKVIKGNHI